MRAVVRRGGGMRLAEDAGRPGGPGPGEATVRIRAAGLNPVDYKLPALVGGETVGLDFAGCVHEVGPGEAGGLCVGDEVYGTCRGSLADVARVPVSQIARKPPQLSFSQAACMPTVYITALQALRASPAKQGGRVVIIGASGGCGLAAVQLAKAMGFSDIIGVCSGKNEELVKSHGCTRVIDYTKEKLSDSFNISNDEELCDLILDAATASGHGEDYTEEACSILRQSEPHGEYVAFNGGAMTWIRHFTIGQPKHQRLILTDMNTADLDELSSLVASHDAVRPLVSKSVPFQEKDVLGAFDLLKGRHVVGKIVVEMDDAN